MTLICGQVNGNIHAVKPAHVRRSQQPAVDQLLQRNRRRDGHPSGLQISGICSCRSEDTQCIYVPGLPTGGGDIHHAPYDNGNREDCYYDEGTLHTKIDTDDCSFVQILLLVTNGQLAGSCPLDRLVQPRLAQPSLFQSRSPAGTIQSRPC